MRFGSRIVVLATVFVTAPLAALVAQPAAPQPGQSPTGGSGAGSDATEPQPGGGSDAGSATDPGAGSAGGDAGSGADAGGGGEGTEGEGTIAEELGIAPEIFTARLYGYIDARFEKSQAQPGLDEMGNTIKNTQPAEWDIPNFHVMLQGRIYGQYRYFINLAAPGSGSAEDATIDLRNAWVEFPIYRDFFNFRAGKTYRRFGLYNEILDAVPTFIGIEPPEMFDKDHLMLTRTTNAMLHGTLVSGTTSLSYALMTGNDERAGAQLPFGADLRFDFASKVKLGVSYYNSNGRAAPTTDVGGGVPLGGTAQWMAFDEFQVYGGFGQVTAYGITLQAEYTRAHHDAQRDPARTLALLDAGLFPRQAQRFGLDGAAPTEADVIVPVSYDVTAAYSRLGYQIDYEGWQFVPYGQFDYYKNPEIINEKDFGGDNEAGLADDGTIFKYTLGVVVRPVRFVALKLDGSAHGQDFNGDYFIYNEVRASFSLYWELGDGD